MTKVFFWFSERLQDFAMWPINLVRDFPIRVSRLIHTLALGFRGLGSFPVDLWRARRNGRLSQVLKDRLGAAGAWFYRLLVQLFDLTGGPEITQFFMHLITNTTPLTGDEIAVISSVLGTNGLRFGEVRVAEGGLFDLVFKYNGNLAFATWHTINIPRTGRHTRANRSIIVHELTHVYQYEQVGSRYLGEAIYVLVATKRNCYDYGAIQGLREASEAGLQYCDFNREQQAQITQDYFTLKARGVDVTAYEPFLAQLRAGII